MLHFWDQNEPSLNLPNKQIKNSQRNLKLFLTKSKNGNKKTLNVQLKDNLYLQ